MPESADTSSRLDELKTQRLEAARKTVAKVNGVLDEVSNSVKKAWHDLARLAEDIPAQPALLGRINGQRTALARLNALLGSYRLKMYLIDEAAIDALARQELGIPAPIAAPSPYRSVSR